MDQHHLEHKACSQKSVIVFIKNLWNFWAVLKPCLDLMMSFKNCIRIRIASFCHPTYYFWHLGRCLTSVSRPCALGGVVCSKTFWHSNRSCHFLDILYPSETFTDTFFYKVNMRKIYQHHFFNLFESYGIFKSRFLVNNLYIW